MIATLKEVEYSTPDDLAGKRVATSYPGLTNAWLQKNGVDANAIMMKGSVEVAPRLKVADAVCDIVSTGATLDANGLKPVAEVLRVRSGVGAQ